MVETPLSDLWMENVARLLPIWQAWWGYVPRIPIAETRPDARETSSGSALLFSAGVDSFFSLISGAKPEILVSVQGFDMPLDDTTRMAGLRTALHAAARAYACRPVVVRTNLREHPSSGRPHLWERSHGGALVAIGHLLSGGIGRLVVSASYNVLVVRPWGSSPMTDPLLAANGFAIDYFGGHTRREDKAKLLASDPLVRRHLRVCWENGKASGNCSRCEKCLVTMLHLVECGMLREFEVFDGADELCERIDAVPILRHHMNVVKRIIERGKVEPDVTRSLSTLLRRSRRVAPVRQLKSRVRDLVDRYV